MPLAIQTCRSYFELGLGLDHRSPFQPKLFYFSMNSYSISILMVQRKATFITQVELRHHLQCLFTPWS